MTTIIPRAEWGAKPIKGRAAVLNDPAVIRGSVIHHGGAYWDRARNGAQLVRDVQRMCQTPKPAGKGYSDIMYSFLVTPTLTGVEIYEGRGLRWDQFANGDTKVNRPWLSIMIAGDYRLREELSPRETGARLNAVDNSIVVAVAELVQLVANTYPGANEVTTHDKLNATGCPGGTWRQIVAAGWLNPIIERPSLYLGTRGDLVERLQHWLNAIRSASLLVDGYFGLKTQAAVRAWQNDTAMFFTGEPYNGNEAGWIGPEGWRAIEALSPAGVTF